MIKFSKVSSNTCYPKKLTYKRFALYYKVLPLSAAIKYCTFILSHFQNSWGRIAPALSKKQKTYFHIPGNCNLIRKWIHNTVSPGYQSTWKISQCRSRPLDQTVSWFNWRLITSVCLLTQSSLNWILAQVKPHLFLKLSLITVFWQLLPNLCQAL